MKYNFLQRQSIRLFGYDYSQSGHYFITICIKNREHLFGEVINDKMVLSKIGEIVKKEWWETFYLRSNVDIDKFVIMPNHFHAIVEIMWNGNPVGIDCNQYLRNNEFGPQYNNLFSIVRGFKGAVTRKANFILNSNNSIWQSRFYDHIIRDEKSLNNIRQYIINNPKNWKHDLNNLNYFAEINLKQREKLIKKEYKKLF